MHAVWQNLDVIRALLTVSALIPIALFTGAGFWHFGGKHETGTRFVSIASLCGFIAIVYTVWNKEAFGTGAVAGLSLQILSAFFFGWCIGTSAKSNLSLAFSEHSSNRLITDGPYAFVRHPLYASYILFWIGGAVMAPSPFTLLFAVLLIVIYIYAARREDKILAERFGDDFSKWRKDTGALFPKWRFPG